MDISVKKVAVGAVRLAAIAQFGPLAGGLFLAGGAVAGKILAESKWAESAADMLMHLASDKAGDLFGSAAEGFRNGRNGAVEESMQKAALAALDTLRDEAPAGFADWFDAWRHHLTLRPAAEVFAGARDVDPVALEYDDEQFRALWWSRMEPVLAGWYTTEKSAITQMHLSAGRALPPELTAFLRQRLPEAMQAAHVHVLRDKALEQSWIAFQQHVYHDTLNQLHAIRGQLDRIESKLDAKLDGQAQTKTVWSIPRPTEHFQDRPELIAQIDAALDNSAITALTALHGLPGIGKTQMARKFAELRRERYRLGVWIESETEASLLASFSAVSRLLGWPPDQDQRAEALRVINEISAREPWLAIFDNAESPEALRPWVERLSGHGQLAAVALQLRGMGGAVDLLKLANGHVRVDLRGLQIGVPEHSLNEADVRAAFQHQRGHGVAEQMARALLADIGLLHVTAHHFGEIVERERFAGVGQEHHGVVGLADELRARFLNVLAHPRRRAIAERDHAVLVSLALMDGRRRALEIQVPQLEIHELEPPHAGGVERLEDGAIAQAQHVVHVGLCDHLLGFGGRQHRFRQAHAQPRQLQLAGRGVQESEPVQPGLVIA